MRFITMIREESSISLPGLVVVAGLAGLATALILAIINNAAPQAADQEVSSWYLALFVLAIVLWIVAQRYVRTTSAEEIERLLHQIRVRVADKVRHSDLAPFEHVGRPEIYASISKDTQTISQSTQVLLDGAQSVLLVLFITLYLAWLSLPAFILTAMVVAMAVSVYFKHRVGLQATLKRLAETENQLWDAMSGLLDGFKSVRINGARSEDLFAHIRDISAEAMAVKVESRHQFTGQFIFSQSTFYLLLATLVFVVPRFSTTYGEVVVKTTTAVLFLIGPVASVVIAIPTLAESNAAAERIVDLEARLDLTAYRPPAPGQTRSGFREIRLDGVAFHYQEGDGVPAFGVGPVDLEIRAGEVLFIAGGNGSGKSTLLKLVTALYHPKRGALRLDGEMVVDENREAYHSLFAAVFSDFHLFRRFYGIPAFSPEELENLLRVMELEGKVGVTDGEFDSLNLSGGQRKRLALLVAYLEQRPIFLLDEWAADQDPLFRRKFYEELLPELKRRGKTVVAVTHDDQYFKAADRLFVMNEGRLEERDR